MPSPTSPTATGAHALDRAAAQRRPLATPVAAPPRSGRPPVLAPSPSRGAAGQSALVLLLAAVGWSVAWGLSRALHPHPTGDGTVPGGPALLVALVSLAAVVALGGLLRWRTRAPVGVATLAVAATSMLLAGFGTLSLTGTRWSFGALWSDAGFRTEAVTRFADSPALNDYAYRGLPAYYPPTLSWLEGRAADLLGVPAWTVMKPTALLALLVVPLVAWLMWRRVVPDGVAAVVVALVSLVTVSPVKPDEWLVLSVLLPWWLDIARGVRRHGLRAAATWKHGVLLGLLLTVHSYFFLPMALASAVGVGVDLLRRRRPTPTLRTAVVVGAIGLLGATPYWVPMLLAHGDGPSDNLQMRWTPPGFDVPHLPLPLTFLGTLGLLGVIWMVTSVGRSRLAESLLTATVVVYAFDIGGQVLQRWDIALLPEKSNQLVAALLGASGALAVATWVPALVRRARSRSRTWSLATVGALAAALVAVLWWHPLPLTLDDRATLAAQHTPYPDGSLPPGGPLAEAHHEHAWGVSPTGRDASTDAVLGAWRSMTGRPMDDRTVVVSARSDLLALTPAHPFVIWKSIYSHPHGQFARRVRVLQDLAGCGTPRCAAYLLGHNGLDRVDGLVLHTSGDRLTMTVAVDRFPDGWAPREIRFPRRIFAAPYFSTRQVGDVTVVTVDR